MRPLVQFTNLFLSGTMTGIVFTHVMKRRAKADLGVAGFLDSQQVLLRSYGRVAGSIESTALATSVVLAIAERKRQRSFALSTLAATTHLAMLVIWAIWIRPINNRVNSWTADSLPTDWESYRERWENLHAIRAMIAAFGFATVAASSVLPQQSRDSLSSHHQRRASA